MNFQLLKCGFLPIAIKNNEKTKYYNALDEYEINNNFNPFIELIHDLEEEQLVFYLKQISSKINRGRKNE
jgi:hypothetical protein